MTAPSAAIEVPVADESSIALDLPTVGSYPLPSGVIVLTYRPAVGRNLGL
jgi:hypothetical protein